MSRITRALGTWVCVQITRDMVVVGKHFSHFGLLWSSRKPPLNLTAKKHNLCSPSNVNQGDPPIEQTGALLVLGDDAFFCCSLFRCDG